MVGSAHTHPTNTFAETAHGMSGEDYTELLSDPSEQFALMAWGEGDFRMVVLKTSVTPNKMSQEDVKTRIKKLEDEFLHGKSGISMKDVVDFNKMMCLEFGLTMYLADAKSRDLYDRVDVTR